MRSNIIVLLAIVLLLTFIAFPHHAYGQATFVVDSTGDSGDSNAGDGVCDSGTGNCTLRAAIEEANATSGSDFIKFDIAGSGPHTIQPASALPIITDPLRIDGSSQLGASVNTNPMSTGSNAVLKIELDGTNAGSSTDGLRITAGSSRVEGLVINRFAGAAIRITSNGSNMIEGNFIGTNVAGTAGLGNGVGVACSTSGNEIGGITSGDRNVISNNLEANVALSTTGSTGNLVQGNFIGTDINGTIALGGGLAGGVQISGSSNTVGGTTIEARNVISGNAGEGIRILDSGATGNLVQGNFIGTDVTGAAALANGTHGVFINSDSSGNTVGGTTAAARNVISGNGDDGVNISNATGNLVQGNFIGTDVSGTAALGNTGQGVDIFVAPDNTVGGTTGTTPAGPCTGACNVISANGFDGVFITGLDSTGNLVQGNFIGTDVTGAAALGNAGDGVGIEGDSNAASSNTIGGTTAAARNIISGNNAHGVEIAGSTATGNIVQGNFIGTDVNGTADLGNAGSGVLVLAGASSNSVGGTTAGAGNVISGNDSVGISLSNAGTSNNLVQGNFIGTDVNGTADLGNSFDGVFIGGGATNNTIGGTTVAARNLVSGNDQFGIFIFDVGTSNNVLQGNFIGTDATGANDLGNSSNGIHIFDAPDNTIGGTTGTTAGGPCTGACNLISGNNDHGIRMTEPGATGNLVLGNFIGTNASGTIAVANGTWGVGIWNGAKLNFVGTDGNGADDAAEGNVISGNTFDGVVITFDAEQNVVAGNHIGTDPTGTSALPNGVSSNRGGVELANGAKLNRIGTDTNGVSDDLERNVISGNATYGVTLFNDVRTGTDQNVIAGNFIGTDVGGTADLGNSTDGVSIQGGASSNTVGGTGGYVNRCVNDIRRRPSQPLIQWRFHPHTVHRDRRLRSTQGPSDA